MRKEAGKIERERNESERNVRSRNESERDCEMRIREGEKETLINEG